MNNLTEFIDCLARVSEFGKLLQSKGRAFTPATKQLPQKKRGPLGQCFKNAATRREFLDMTYCEGYACKASLGVPLLHAWLVNEEGEAVEATKGWDTKETSYFGICIPGNLLWKELSRKGHYGVLEMPSGEFIEALKKENTNEVYCNRAGADPRL